jgi:hypothetical protein
MAAAALDALPCEETSAARRHATLCAVCGRVLSDFDAVAFVLGLGVVQIPPPAALKQKVLAAAACAAQQEGSQ